MKSYFKILIITFYLFFSCSDKDDNQPLIFFTDGILQYDGSNIAAPTFEAGENEVAVRFPQELLSDFQGKPFKEVQFFLYEMPEQCMIEIYTGTNNGDPGSLLYAADVTEVLEDGKWNSHSIAEDIVVGTSDVWIVITFSHPESARLIGCDEGPQLENGAMILEASETSWKAFEIDVNWNIRGILED